MINKNNFFENLHSVNQQTSKFATQKTLHA